VRLEAVGAEVRFGPRPVLQDVNLAVESGELVAVCGPNGAGKSTLLRCLAGLLRPSAGTVRLDGVEVSQLPPRERARRVAYLPQDPAVPTGFRCLEVVRMGRYAAGRGSSWRPEEDREAARIMRLAGERQRVLLGRVLAQGARVLLLDEPTAHLDLAAQVQVITLLRGLRDAGYAVVAATHDLNVASLFFDRVVLLSGGRVLRDGPPEAVLVPETVRAAYGEAALLWPHPQMRRPVVLPRVDGP
jgi:iron complex transport system ATP-binding protein